MRHPGAGVVLIQELGIIVCPADWLTIEVINATSRWLRQVRGAIIEPDHALPERVGG